MLHRRAAGLVVMHVADVLQPLLILLHAGKVLGPDGFGQYAYTLAITAIGCTVVDYGFDFTARRAAASAQYDPTAIRIIYAEVTTVKSILSIGVCLLGLMATSVSQALSPPVFLCLLLAITGEVLSPVWLFVALERPWRAAVAIVIARSVALVAFLTIVHSPSQAFVAAAIQASIPLATAIISLPAILSIGISGFKSLSVKGLVSRFKEGQHSFISIIAITATALLPVPLVQHFAGFAAAGYYSAAEKLVNVARPMFRVIADFLMPRVAYLASHDPAKGLVVIWKSLWTLIASIALSLILYFNGPYVLIVLFGPQFSDAGEIVRILSVLPVLMNIRLCMADLYMFHYGHDRGWMALTAAGLPIFLVTAFLLSWWASGERAIAIGIVAGELFIALVATRVFAASMKMRSSSISKSGIAGV
jgi:O-antigen/teichoic acid export membrane protein